MRCWCLKHFIQPHNLATYTYWMPFAHPNTQVRGRDGDAAAVSVAAWAQFGGGRGGGHMSPPGADTGFPEGGGGG